MSAEDHNRHILRRPPAFVKDMRRELACLRLRHMRTCAPAYMGRCAVRARRDVLGRTCLPERRAHGHMCWGS